MPAAAIGAGLSVGYYEFTCPSAEQVVYETIAAAYANNPGIAPGLIRMFFHDCFVRGCDASVLLDSTPGNEAEKDALPNNPSLHGFDVIDAAKSALEAVCPETVSCADVVAFAARDSATLSGDIYFEVPAGRRDGLVSLAAEALANLPSPLSNASTLVEAFAKKNLTAAEMVTLSGAHSIGVSHCGPFRNRIYNFSSPTGVDPSLNPAYAARLQRECPFNDASSGNTTVVLDTLTPVVLDNLYYVGLKLGLGLFTSDAALLTDGRLREQVGQNALFGELWAYRFARAMVKMGKIEVKTGTEGRSGRTVTL
ncbi:hypothetical protein HPP92_017664 [Vanilla planifolia]|uniref:Peroxidase n=1 Tax=Vanilla planifolia TaxID=51239 RepID=A0A835Q9H1_VANPL|nr:hypothetical protein HPP92_018275 [Vanilla planifolia]KAG0466698.1 hypothetical protein HPP92_018278 [Vanilla planifolia]KAG0468336.1 hypothetical protein HPP92_017664 [Vanilla planifolia]